MFNKDFNFGEAIFVDGQLKHQGFLSKGVCDKILEELNWVNPRSKQ